MANGEKLIGPANLAMTLKPGDVDKMVNVRCGIRVWAVGVALSHMETALDANRDVLTTFLR